ncbi:MAG: YbhB/YbcL family Raf kinase inhibitor-like protein [Flavisolibacter sp.]
MNPIKSIMATKVEDYKFITVTSKAFFQNEMIPSRYTCDGANTNPPLHLEGIPEASKSLAIIVDDPDAPGGNWVHWVVWNIPVTHEIREGDGNGEKGLNDFKKHNYGGPCPPSGTHHYYFKVFALDTILELDSRAGKDELEKAMIDHILGMGILIGKYAREK